MNANQTADPHAVSRYKTYVRIPTGRSFLYTTALSASSYKNSRKPQIGNNRNKNKSPRRQWRPLGDEAAPSHPRLPPPSRYRGRKTLSTSQVCGDRAWSFWSCEPSGSKSKRGSGAERRETGRGWGGGRHSRRRYQQQVTEIRKAITYPYVVGII